MSLRIVLLSFAVWTSHDDRSKIEDFGAHYVVENMDYVSWILNSGLDVFVLDWLIP